MSTRHCMRQVYRGDWFDQRFDSDTSVVILGNVQYKSHAGHFAFVDGTSTPAAASQTSALAPTPTLSGHRSTICSHGQNSGAFTATVSSTHTTFTQGVCSNPDPSTKDFIMQQTMLRIKDPQASLDFYTRVLGMRLLHKFDFAEMSFSLYFVGYCDPSHIPTDNAERVRVRQMNGVVSYVLTLHTGTDSFPLPSTWHYRVRRC